MAARAKARKRALDILFASEMRQRSTEEALGELGEAGPVNDYTLTLVRGVTEHRDRIDEVIGSYAKGWSLDRMPAVDRNVLRMATYEILYVDEVPYAVAVSEAMHLVRNLSTDESPSFVNGVLGNIVRDRDALVR
jgi:N utilization substance protein B